jgi:hypothetical protein
VVRKLDPSDFRARRYVLEPEDFALGSDEPDPPPTDLISEDVWRGITDLPSDVAIRTTSYQGTRVAVLYELWSGWIHATPMEGIVGEAMMESADDFAVALFNLLHGFYKPAISALRNALEVVTLACACGGDGAKKWREWREGADVKFKLECDSLQSLPNYRELEEQARQAMGTSVFAGDNGSGRNAWARNLYRRLSQFSHAGGDSINSALWESNGPVYSADGMRVSYHAYIETYALLLLLAKVSSPDLKMPTEARVIYKEASYKQYLAPPFQGLCAFYHGKLFTPLRKSVTSGVRFV